jgi:hypothetical protein
MYDENQRQSLDFHHTYCFNTTEHGYHKSLQNYSCQEMIIYGVLL